MHPFDIIIISKSYRKIIIKNEVKKLRLGALKSKLEPFLQSCYIPFSCFVLCRYLDEAGLNFFLKLSFDIMWMMQQGFRCLQINS